MQTEPRAHAKFEQAASIEYSQFDPISSAIAAEKIFKPRLGQKTNEALVNGLVPSLESKLNGYDGILGKRKYLSGDVCCARSVFEDEVLLMGPFTYRGLPSQISSTCHAVALLEQV